MFDNWDWSIFWPVCFFVLAIAGYFGLLGWIGGRMRRKHQSETTANIGAKIRTTYQLWFTGSVRGGQVYRHHSGREYLIVSIFNGLCDDKIKWPLTVVYCDVKMTSWYARPLWQFLDGCQLNREIDNDATPAVFDLMAMARFDGKVEAELPQPQSVWTEGEPSQPYLKRPDVVVTQVYNKNLSQPIVSYYAIGREHEALALPLYLFLRKYSPVAQEKAA